jgi:S1-C subfamily serine protease
MIKMLLIAGLFCSCSVAVYAENGSYFNGIIFEVIATYQEYQPLIPWQMSAPKVRNGFCVALTNGLVIVPEEIIRNSTLVEVQSTQGGKKYKANIVEDDQLLNAAILKVEDDAFIKKMQGLVVDQQLSEGETVALLKPDSTTGKIISDSGRLIEFLGDGGGVSKDMVYKIKTEMNFEGAGLPVLKDGKLVGINLRYDSTTRSALVLNGQAIERFIAEGGSSNYTGLAWAGFMWTQLLDPVKRRYLNAPDEEGILVLRTIPGSGAADVLLPQDVILKWNGIAIDQRGYYQDKKLGKMALQHLICGCAKPGDFAELEVIRKGERKFIHLKLSSFDDKKMLIPENSMLKPVSYIVEGGIILRELTGDYLKAFGANWAIQSDPRLAYYYLNGDDGIPYEPGRHIVLLSAVLPDEINVDYQEFSNEIVVEVNGKPIKNIEDIFKVLVSDKQIKSLKLYKDAVEVVLDENMLKEANQRIRLNYRIPELRKQIIANSKD